MKAAADLPDGPEKAAGFTDSSHGFLPCGLSALRSAAYLDHKSTFCPPTPPPNPDILVYLT
jgi:hypothetical protein